MVFLRSLLFKVLFPLWTGVACVFFMPLLLSNVSARKLAISGRVWANGVMFLLKWVCDIRFEIRGKENLPNRPCVLACQHQSVWDTIVFLAILDHPAYILKQELLKIPSFGKYLINLEMIAIDRSAGSSALKKMINDTRLRIKEGRTVVIFPEGTRVPVGEKREYQPGVAFLYKDEEVPAPIIPVALNSGLHWNAGFIKKPGVIVLEYLPALEKGIPRKEFMTQLQQRLERKAKEISPKLNGDGDLDKDSK